MNRIRNTLSQVDPGSWYAGIAIFSIALGIALAFLSH